MNFLRRLYNRLPWIRSARASNFAAQVSWMPPQRPTTEQAHVLPFGDTEKAKSVSERGSISLKRAA